MTRENRRSRRLRKKGIVQIKLGVINFISNLIQVSAGLRTVGKSTVERRRESSATRRGGAGSCRCSHRSCQLQCASTRVTVARLHGPSKLGPNSGGKSQAADSARYIRGAAVLMAHSVNTFTVLMTLYATCICRRTVKCFITLQDLP